VKAWGDSWGVSGQRDSVAFVLTLSWVWLTWMSYFQAHLSFSFRTTCHHVKDLQLNLDFR
jgi:hypothetical protein